MAKKVQLMTNAKEWQTVNGVEVLVDVPQEDIDPITDSNCVEIEGHRTLEETISQENMFTPEIVETKVHSKVGGVYHDNVVDGAYEEAILYGNTQVNLVESMTSDTKYIPHSFTSFQGNESKIGNYHNGRTNQVAPLVKGVTMVNLCQETSLTIQYQHTRVIANRNAKPNTKYTLKCKFTEKNKNAGIMIQSYGYKDGTWGYIEISKTIQNLGDDVLLTFTTHEQADSIIIYNNPAFCTDTSDSITLEDIMVIEGDVTDLDLPFFKGMRSVELSRPLTNLFNNNTPTNHSWTGVTNVDGTVTATSQVSGTWTYARFNITFKPNTSYVVMWDSLTYTQTGNANQTIAICYGNDIIANIDNNFTNKRSIIFNTGDRNPSDINLRIHATTSNTETGTTTVTGLRVFEYDDSLRSVDLQSIGYFSGTKYVSARALETEGKNLYPYGDVNFTPTLGNAWYDAKGNAYMTGDIAEKSKSRFLLKKGTYKFTVGNTSNCSYQLIDDKEQLIASAPTFNLTQDTYCTLRVKTTEANVAATITNIQIERGEAATTYEAYQSRYYKPRETEEIILRSLSNGVCDTFNLQTGELVQRIGEVYYDGSDDEVWQRYADVEGFATDGFYITLSHVAVTQQGKDNTICDKMITDEYRHIQANATPYDREAICSDGSYIKLRLLKTKASTVAEFKTYLQSNPITVQYELKEPIITKLQTYARVYSGQTNARTNMGNNLSALTYYSNNYYLKVGNLSPVPAILEPITSIPYDVRLKPSTLYTIKYNRGGNSNSMKFDLGGSVVEKTNSITSTTGIAEELTVRTPAILSHEQLILSGTGYAHNFIIVEGDITGTELPYFEGMKDVKMPIVKNISRNLFDIQSIYQGLKNIAPNNVLLLNDNTLQIKTTSLWHKNNLGKPIKFKENTRYTLSFYVKDINNTGELPDTIICFVYTDGSTSFSRAWGDNVCTSTTGKTVDYIEFSYGYGYGERIAEFSNFMLVEGTETQPYEPYKENSVYAVQGEYPITSEMIEQGGFSMSGFGDGSYEKSKYDNTARLRSKDLIPVKPNTTYAFTHSFSKFAYNIYQWNGNKKFIDGASQYFANGQIETITTTADTQYIHFLISKDDAKQDITVAEYDWSQFHMYELDSTINLRSLPNGVKDELNLLTGEYIQRVGEIVLDGSEYFDTTESYFWFINQNLSNENYTTFMLEGRDGKPSSSNFICDKLPNKPTWLTVETGVWADSAIVLTLPTNTVTTTLQLQEYLQSNPLTIQYELAEPIISYPRIVSNNQEREVGVKLPNGVSNTYNPSTGITTVRVGKIVLDGSENWILFEDATITSGLKYFRMPNPSMKPYNIQSYCNWVLSDSLPTVPYDDIYIHGTSKKAAISGVQSFGLGGIGALYIYYSEITTVEQLKTWLSQNPVTVWYELKYPQIQPDIVLPNGVHDEYNPETGVYTKKVGFAEFDGSADEGWRAAQTDPNRFVCEILTDRKYYSSDVIKDCMLCDKITVVSYKELYGTDGTDGVYGIAPFGSSANIQMRLEGITTAEQLQQYLSQNPIKVWYELATPITYQLTPYFGLPQPYAYEDGYLIHESAYPETTLPPEFKYKLIANRTGQIVQNNRKLQEHTTRLSNLEALIIEATIESLFNRELQLFELELMDIQLIDLGE